MINFIIISICVFITSFIIVFLIRELAEGGPILRKNNYLKDITTKVRWHRLLLKTEYDDLPKYIRKYKRLLTKLPKQRRFNDRSFTNSVLSKINRFDFIRQKYFNKDYWLKDFSEGAATIILSFSIFIAFIIGYIIFSFLSSQTSYINEKEKHLNSGCPECVYNQIKPTILYKYNKYLDDYVPFETNP